MNQQELGQRTYVSRFNGEDNQNQSTNKKAPRQYINESDPFRITQVAGKGFMAIFYAGIVAGILCAALGVILTVVPGTADEDVIKSNLLDINSKWIYENKQQLIKNFNVQVDLLEQDAPLFQINSEYTKNKKQYNPLVDSNKMELKDSLSISQQKSQVNYQIGSTYQQPFVSFQNSHFESKINLNADPIFPSTNHCLQVKITDNQDKELNVQGLPTCGSVENALPINLVQNKVLKFSDMIKMNLCSDDLSCEKTCELNNGVPNAIQKKSKNTHTLEKNYVVQKQTCTADFAVKEVCLVFSLNHKTNTISKFESGCYEGNYMIYDFESKVSETSIVLREKEDPLLASISYSSNYTPYVVGQTQKEKTALVLYYIGAGIFALLIASLIIVRIKEERDAKFTKVSRVTELTSQQTISNQQ